VRAKFARRRRAVSDGGADSHQTNAKYRLD